MFKLAMRIVIVVSLVIVAGLAVLVHEDWDDFAVARHPLDALTYDEIVRATEALRAAGHAGPSTLYPTIALEEMDKAAVRAWQAGAPMGRAARVVAMDGAKAFEAIIDLEDIRVSAIEPIEGVEPKLVGAESAAARHIVEQDPGWQAAMRQRG